jgi:hypothetical protein
MARGKVMTKHNNHNNSSNNVELNSVKLLPFCFEPPVSFCLIYFSTKRGSQAIAMAVLLYLQYVCLTATDNWRGFAKFPNFVVGNFCAWLHLDAKYSLLGASNCGKRQLAWSCLSVRLYHGTAGLTAGGVSRLLISEYFSNICRGELKLRVILLRKFYAEF